MSSALSASVDSIIHLPKVVTLKGTDSPSHALKVFAENHITSAPVLDSSEKLLGVLEINDIVSWIVQYIYKKYSIHNKDQQARIEAVSKLQVKTHDLEGFVHKFEHFPVEEILNTSESLSTSCVLPPSTTVLEALNRFYPSTNSATWSTNRLVIVDPQSKKIVNYISKSALLKYLSKHSELYSHISNEALRTLGRGIIQIGAVCHHPSSTPLVGALALLHEYGLNTLALLDEHDPNHKNLPLTVLSVSDLKGLLIDPRHLSESVQDYIRAVRSHSPQTNNPFVCINDETSFGVAIEKLSTVHLHQIYVVKNLKSEEHHHHHHPPNPKDPHEHQATASPHHHHHHHSNHHSHEGPRVVGVCTLDSLLDSLKKNLK